MAGRMIVVPMAGVKLGRETQREPGTRETRMSGAGLRGQEDGGMTLRLAQCQPA